VWVAPGFARAPIARALRLLGRGCAVRGHDAAPDGTSGESGAVDGAAWSRALLAGCRVQVGAASGQACARAFASAGQGHSVVAVLGV
jgi:hypothetical protein